MRYVLAVLLVGSLAGCGWTSPTGSKTEVNCENQTAVASVHCPDSPIVVPPPPAEQKKGG